MQDSEGTRRTDKETQDTPAEVSLTLTKAELTFLQKSDDELTAFNKRMMQVRKINLQNSFIEATNTRLAMLKKIRNWIDIIEKRVFDPTMMATLDIDKVIVLLKLSMRYTDRIMAQIQTSEKCMKMYTDIDTMQVKMDNLKNTNMNDDARRDLKEKMLKAVLGSLTETIEEAEVVEKQKIEDYKEQEKKYEVELEDLEKDMKEKNPDLDKIDEEIPE